MSTLKAMVANTSPAEGTDRRKARSTRKITTALTSARVRRSANCERISSLSSASSVYVALKGATRSSSAMRAFTASATRTVFTPADL